MKCFTPFAIFAVGALLLQWAPSSVSVAEVFHLSFDEDGGSVAGDSVLVDGTATPDDSAALQNGAHFVPARFGMALELSSTSAAPEHRFASLVGASDGESGDQGHLHVTYHHNWWAPLCQERMPSLRFGRAHVFNNYYNCAGNNYCVRTRLYAESRIENNCFENVHNPWEVFVTTGDTGKVYVAGNLG